MTNTRNETGFLYVEALVAMLLLAFTLLATAPMLVLGARENASAGDLTFATTIANDRAEALKRMTTAAMTSGNDVIVHRNIRYTRTWVITDNTPHPGMRRATVTVTPQRQKTHGGTKVTTITFYRAP